MFTPRQMKHGKRDEFKAYLEVNQSLQIEDAQRDMPVRCGGVEPSKQIGCNALLRTSIEGGCPHAWKIATMSLAAP
jgi:hypothetical protein